MLATLPTSMDVSGSVLFLGSGFSAEARNIYDDKLRTGDGLKVFFAELMKVDANAYDLSTLAEEVASKLEFNLYQILYKLFTIRQLTEHQKSILRLPWRRIYTTTGKRSFCIS